MLFGGLRIRTVSQIDICFGTMRYDRFWLEHQELKHGFMAGTLSTKSQKLIAEKLSDDDISITQNFFYDMYFEGMSSYIDLGDAI